MTTEEADILSRLLCGAFRAMEDTRAAFTLVLKDYGFSLMEEAVKECIAEGEKMPTPRQLIAKYRKAEAERKASTEDGHVAPCFFCAEVGVHRDSMPPYLPTCVITDDEGHVLGPAWGWQPACAEHGLEISKTRGHRGYETDFEKRCRHNIEKRRSEHRMEAVNRGCEVSYNPSDPACLSPLYKRLSGGA